MQVVVNIFHIVKAQSLIDGNEFLRAFLYPTSAGSWLISPPKSSIITSSEAAKEIERIFTTKGVKHTIKA